MDGFEVTVDGLRDAGRVGRSLAGDMAALPLAEAALTVGDALPGGSACDAAASLAGKWRVRLAASADGVMQHAVALCAAADGYAAAERSAVGALAGEPSCRSR